MINNFVVLLRVKFCQMSVSEFCLTHVTEFGFTKDFLAFLGIVFCNKFHVLLINLESMPFLFNTITLVKSDLEVLELLFGFSKERLFIFN
jgi:hypothetical protein